MPCPYLGSKNKSASRIVNIIEAYCPNNNKTIIELFTGGFAIGEEFYKKGYKVIANDKNKYVIALLNKVINDKLDEAKCLEWVNREKFFDVLKNKDKYEDWYAGYVMQIWSFGNNQQTYLFSNDKEVKKHSLYNLVVYKKVDEFVKSIIPKKYIEGILSVDNWHKRRMALKKVLGVLKKKMNLQSLERLQRLQSLQNLERLQSLERLQRLQSLQSLEILENIKFTSLDYEDVILLDGAIIYCDPPYKGTATYAEGGFNHDKFWDYMRKISKTHKVFISEYTAPEDFKMIYEFSQKSSLHGGLQTHNNQPNEKLFIYNGL